MQEPTSSDALVRDEEDHDLLTFSEAGIRLRDEIAAAEATLAGDLPAAERELLETRLAGLREAQVRNTRHAETGAGEAGFLAYAPPRGGSPS